MSKLMKALAIGAALAAASATGAQASTNLISNGHFVGPLAGPSFVTVTAGSSAIPDWDVLTGDVDWIQGYWPGSDGDGFSIDLNGNNPGSIGQSISTVAGKTYTVKFDMAANPDFGGVRIAIVGADGATIGTQEYDLGLHDPVVWSTRYATFTATGSSTLISFSSGNNEQCCYGAAIDNVSAYVPEPATWALMITGFGAAGAMLRRRRAALA